MATEINSDGIVADQITISSPTVPATPTSPGTVGDLAWDGDYMYMCIAADSWARVKHSTEWDNAFGS